MATYTANYSLKKPEQEDLFNIDDVNENMDIIDTALSQSANNLTEEQIRKLDYLDAAVSSRAAAEDVTSLLSRGTVKSVQRGVTSGAATVTISEVVMNKAVVFSTSKGSSGYVAARGSITGNLSGTYNYPYLSGQYSSTGTNNTGTVTLGGTRTLSGGTTDLTAKLYSAKLTSPTSLVCDGPVEWQVVEYY